MRLCNYDTNETIDEDATPELRSAACESEEPVLGFWNSDRSRWELTSRYEESFLRIQRGADVRVMPMYGLP